MIWHFDFVSFILGMVIMILLELTILAGGIALMSWTSNTRRKDPEDDQQSS